MAKKIREIKIDQLLEERAFLAFCNDDHHGGYGKRLETEITQEFLIACEKDRFIVPIHIQKEAQIVDGKEVQVDIKYYSPFQLFLVAEFCKNIIDEEGYLRDTMTDVNYQKEHKTRYINWGGHSAFNIDNEKTESNNPPNMVSHFTLMKNFHAFLRLLHTFETFDHTRHDDYARRRLYRNAPQLQYDFKDLTPAILAEYSVTTESIKHMCKIMGNFALHIDPLENWYNYIHRHDILRKDEMKGLAGIAQELYNFSDVLIEAIEKLEGKKLPPFLEFVKSDFAYHDREKMNSYADGEDILAIKKSGKDLITWLTDNKEYLDGIFDKHSDWKKVDFLALAQKAYKDLEDFHTLYGDIRYVGSYRTVYPSDKKLEGLDPWTKKHVEMYAKSRSLSSDELQIEISHAVSSRLSDLERNVTGVAYDVSNLLQNDRSRIENEKYMSTGPLQIEYFKEHGCDDDPNPGLTSSLFWREFLPKAQKKYDDEMELLEKKRSELHHLVREAGLVFCAKCREKHVVIHQTHHDEKFSNEAICDDCLSQKDLQSITSGEWYCEHTKENGEPCNTLLYKFAHNNILNTNLLMGSNATIMLNYGQLEIEVKCKICKNKSKKFVDWGWLP